MLKRRAISLSLILSLLSLPTFSQQSERDDDIRTRIRKEGMEHSHILKTMHMLADVYGPRLTSLPPAPQKKPAPKPRRRTKRRTT